MSLKRRGNIEAILKMPEATEDQVKEKLRAAIREISRETDYIEQNMTVTIGARDLPTWAAWIEQRLTAHGI